MALIAADPDCKPNRSTDICNRLDVGRESTRAPSSHIARNMQPTEAELSTNGLPKAFLHSLRTLFDILDDGRKGYVHISEIESRWQGADTQDLPGGVLECLRRVTPPHGCLTFERFVMGLRYSMANPGNGHLKPTCGSQQARSQPVAPKARPGCAAVPRVSENKVRPLGPSNVVNTHQNRPRHEDAANVYAKAGGVGESALYSSVSQVTRARYNSAGYERSGRSLDRNPVVPESVSYRTDLVRPGAQTGVQPNQVRSIESLALESPRLQKSSGDEGRGLPRSQSESTTGLAGTRRHGRSRDEQRRHTITNGVDYGMLKQMKELEQEKDSLLAGLDVVERAREWYQNQIHNVTERQRHMGQNGHGTDFFSEQSQSRMNILLPKLQEVNRCLNDLISCSGVTIMSHGAPPPTVSSNQPPPPPQLAPKVIQRLKEQNRLLTQEVTEKSERITQLEQEKSALIKQLFEARARSAHDGSTLDSTFI